MSDLYAIEKFEYICYTYGKLSRVVSIHTGQDYYCCDPISSESYSYDDAGKIRQGTVPRLDPERPNRTQGDGSVVLK